MSATYLLAHKSAGSHTQAVWALIYALLPDGSTEVVISGSNDHSIRFWNPLSGAVPYKTIQTDFGIVDLAVDNLENATFLVSSSIDSVLTRYDMQGELEARKEFGAGETWNVSIHPRSSHIATTGNDVVIKILSSAIEDFGKKELVKLKGRGTFGTALKYSKDGNYLAVATDLGYVSLFNGNDYSPLSTFPAHSATIRSLAFTATLIITGSDDKKINIFDLLALSSQKTGRIGQVACLSSHDGWITSLTTRNNRLLASGSSDGLIKLHDLNNLGASAISTLRDHSGDVWSLAFAIDKEKDQLEGLGGASAGIVGGRLVSVGEDGDIRWWKG